MAALALGLTVDLNVILTPRQGSMVEPNSVDSVNSL